MKPLDPSIPTMAMLIDWRSLPMDYYEMLPSTLIVATVDEILGIAIQDAIDAINLL